MGNVLQKSVHVLGAPLVLVVLLVGIISGLHHPHKGHPLFTNRVNGGNHTTAVKGVTDTSYAEPSASGTNVVNPNGKTTSTGDGNSASGTSTPDATNSSSQLKISPDTITLNGLHDSETVTISLDGKTQLVIPEITQIPNGPNAWLDTATMSAFNATWHMNVKEFGFDTSGDAYVTVMAKSRGSLETYTGKLRVKWEGIASMWPKQGPLTKTFTDTTVTYTFNFSIEHNAYIGQPVVTASIFTGGVDTASSCKPGSVPTRKFTYSGQHDVWLSCIMDRPVPYVPGSGPPPPLNVQADIRLYISAVLPSGEYVRTGITDVHWFIDHPGE